MILGQDFYDNFIEFSKEEVDVALKIASKRFSKLIYEAFVLGSVEKDSKEVLYAILALKDLIIRGKIYKERLTDYMSKFKSEHVVQVFNNCTNRMQMNLRKRFVLDDVKELKEELTPHDVSACDYAINFLVSALRSGDLDRYFGRKIDIYSMIDRERVYSKEGIDAVFLTLDSLQKAIFYKKLESLSLLNEDLTKEENRNFSNVYKVIKYRLEKLQNGYVVVGVEDIFSTMPLDELREVITSKEDLRSYYFGIFGEDLSRKCLAPSNDISNGVSKKQRLKLESAYNKMKRQREKLKNRKYNSRKKLMPFYSMFSSYRLDSEDSDIFNLNIKNISYKYLNLKHLDILRKFYGDNFDSLNECDEDSLDILYSYIVPRIKAKIDLERSKYKAFTDYFPMFFGKSDINLGYYSLPIHLRDIISLRYIDDLYNKGNFIVLSATEERLFCEAINELVKRVFKIKSSIVGISTLSLRIIDDLTKTEEYKDLEAEYGANVAVAVIANIYFNNITEREIVLLTGIDSSIYLSISLEYLTRIKGDELKLNI